MPHQINSAALDSNWREMTLPHYLKKLRLQVEESWEKNAATSKTDIEYYITLKKKQEKRGSPANASDAKRFLQNSIGIIVRLLRRETVINEASVLGDAKQVDQAIHNEEELLRLIAPDFSVNPSSRWPGPVGYRSALNHLIAVCIRVHAMYPEAKFELILRTASRRILVPALAHNLTFLRRSAPAAFNYLLNSDEGIDRLCKGHLIHKPANGKLPENENNVAETWARLLNAAFHFARNSVINADELFTEIKRLTLEHVNNPTGSTLWNELSVIASGDLSIDELLVARVTTDLQDNLGEAQPTTIIFCARARFGLLRYSYAMTDEREEIAKSPIKTLKTAEEFYHEIVTLTSKGQKLKDDSCKRAFGWAYLWSRYLLLGRAEDKRMEESYFRSTQNSVGMLLVNLLYQVYNHAENTEYKQLALRYVTGFLTNPRFVRPKQLLAGNQEKARNYLQLMRKESLPGGLISMMEARIALHRAYSLRGKPDFTKALNNSLSSYADTLKSISASENSGNMMDGEVPAWAIPEMRFAVKLLKETVTEKGNARTSKLRELERIQKALDMIGEIQFGVYFNQEEEVGRLEKGLELGCADLK